jgi:hypothetical protein
LLAATAVHPFGTACVHPIGIVREYARSGLACASRAVLRGTQPSCTQGYPAELYSGVPSRAVLRGTRVLAGCSGNSQSTRGVLAAYSQRTHRVLTQDSRGIVPVHAALRLPGPQDTKEELVQSSALLQALQQAAIPRDDQALSLGSLVALSKALVHAVGDSGALRLRLK